MSKGLEALEKIDHTVCLAFDKNNNALFNKDEVDHIDCKDIYDFVNCYNDIEKELKALEIIKKKPWFVGEIVECKGDYDVYISWCEMFRADINYRMTKETFDLLKEVLL